MLNFKRQLYKLLFFFFRNRNIPKEMWQLGKVEVRNEKLYCEKWNYFFSAIKLNYFLIFLYCFASIKGLQKKNYVNHAFFDERIYFFESFILFVPIKMSVFLWFDQSFAQLCIACTVLQSPRNFRRYLPIIGSFQRTSQIDIIAVTNFRNSWRERDIWPNERDSPLRIFDLQSSHFGSGKCIAITYEISHEGTWRRQWFDSVGSNPNESYSLSLSIFLYISLLLSLFLALSVPVLFKSPLLDPLVRLCDTLSPPRDDAIASARNESGREGWVHYSPCIAAVPKENTVGV